MRRNVAREQQKIAFFVKIFALAVSIFVIIFKSHHIIFYFTFLYFRFLSFWQTITYLSHKK